MKIIDGKRLPTVNETGIYGFFGEFRWLSNFHPCQIEFEGLIYPSTENAYQAAKFHDRALRLQLTQCTPSQSKKLANAHQIEQENWSIHRLPIMLLLQIKKYAISDLQEKLLLTDGYYLEETNNWGDQFWGVDGEGENNLGHCIMLTRSHYKFLK